MEESINGDSQISSKRLRIVAITLIIVIIVISSGLYFKYSYWNIELSISELGSTDENLTIQCELKNTGYFSIKILDPYFSYMYYVETPLGLMQGPDAGLDIAPSDITLDADESYYWQCHLRVSELAYDTGVDIDEWPIGDISIYCTYQTHGKSGTLKSNTVIFPIE